MSGAAATFSIVIPGGSRNDFTSSLDDVAGSAATTSAGASQARPPTNASQNLEFDISPSGDCRPQHREPLRLRTLRRQFARVKQPNSFFDNSGIVGPSRPFEDWRFLLQSVRCA